ncbi:MAG: FG-GAP-like repeat-containing protein [Saprospiraceae bacterium]
MTRTIYTTIFLFSFLIINAQVNCNSTFPNDSIAFDTTLFTKVNNINYGINQQYNSWSTAFGDYDNDGFIDFFVANYDSLTPNQLYHNNGDGTFTEVTSGNAILLDTAESTSGVWGDYDNDNDLDLFVSNTFGYNNFLYRNDGNGIFTKIINDPIVSYLGFSHGATWVDYDNDGFLDMFVTEYLHIGVNRLYHNNGNGTFTETLNSGLTTDAAYSVSAVWGDYDNDGDQDVFVPNTNNHNNFLYKNNGNGTFTKITTGDIVNDGGESTGASWGDYDNDLDLDLFVANASGEFNFLYQNNGDGTFTKITNSIVTTTAGHSHGSAWADFDNDGDLDLIITNDSNSQNEYYINNGDGTFTAIDNAITNLFGESFGIAVADIDNDNDLDLHVANHDSDENELYINEFGTCNNSISFTLQGTISNGTALGSRIKILTTINGSSIWQMRELSSLTGGGIGGQNDIRVIFGLGAATQVDSVVINWASGLEEIFTNIPITNNSLLYIEPNTSKVCGVVYNDLNRNCQNDDSEMGISNIAVVAQPGNVTTYTNQNGEYEFDLAIGNYTITAIDSAEWEKSCAITAHNVNVMAVNEQYCGYNFADTAICQNPDLYVDLQTNNLYIGERNQYIITIGNYGLQTATDVILKVDFDQDILPFWASLPWHSKEGTTYTWNLGGIETAQHFTIYIEDSIATTAIDGDYLSITATVLDNTLSDCNSSNNIANNANIVSFIDANNMQVSPEGQIDNDEILTYTINFQNLQNGLVDKVIVKNELPKELDITTLENIKTSHPHLYRIDGRLLIWEFENTDLANTIYGDETHGFITFDIKPQSDLVVGTEIKNQAQIISNNMTDITNTVINTIDKTGALEPGELDICPNPMTEYAFIILDTDEEELQEVEIYSMLGIRVVSFNNLSGQRLRLEKSMLPAAEYVVRVTSNNGNVYTKKLLVSE